MQGLAHLQQLLKEAMELMHPMPIIHEKERTFATATPSPLLTRILKDVYLCAARYLVAHSPRLFLLGVTHIVIPLTLLSPAQRSATQ